MPAAASRARKSLTALTGSALALAGLSSTAAPAAHAADPVVINLVGINDFHGRINANTMEWAATVEDVKARAAADHTVFVGAGDLVGASEFASAVADDQPTIDVLDALGLDASSVGNHEFDKGWADLRDRIIDGGTNAAWEYLGANVYQKGSQTPVLPSYWIKDVAGIKVGVVGAVTQETSSLVSPGGIADLDFGPVVPALNRVAGELTDGNTANGEADVLVAVVHAGAVDGTKGYDQEVAQAGEFQDMALHLSPQYNAAFQGHTHQLYAYDAPVTGGDTANRPLLQTGNYGDNVGNIQLSVDPDTKRVLSYTRQNVARRASTPDATLIQQYPQLQQVKNTVDTALANAAAVGNQPVGSISADITTALPDPTKPVTVTGSGNRDDRANESTLGDLVGNALRDGIPADMGRPDIGIVNPGGLRAELLYAGDTSSNPANTDGVVTFAEANNVLPFVNNVWLVDVTGASLKKVLEQQWQPAGASRPFLALGLSDNVQVAYDPAAPSGSHITSVHIDGKPLDPAATYSVSTFSFLGTGGDNFKAFTEGKPKDTGLVDRDLWMSYLGSHPGLSPDFARQQVGVTGTPLAGHTSQIELSKLDLTSAGSPANTSVSVTGTDAGGFEMDLGSFKVSGGGAKRLISVPADLVGGSLTFVASPTGTTVTVPVLTTSQVRAQAPTVNPGNRGLARVTVDADRIVPTGTVTIRNGSTTLGSGTLAGGAVTIGLDTSTLTPGTYTLTATYSGDAAVQGSSSTFTLRVNKATARVTVAKTKRIVRNRTRGVLTIGVTGFQGKPATGRVTVRIAGRTLTATLVHGMTTVRLPRLTAAGRAIARVSYLGDQQTRAATRTVKLFITP